ncbi:MAG: hypothetical protein WDN76_00590 [Alphaproteobacteria bacterium]
MKKTAASQLKPLIDAGFDLIPLPPREKAPRDKGWPDRGYEDFDPVAHMNHGGNVGVRCAAIISSSTWTRRMADWKR